MNEITSSAAAAAIPDVVPTAPPPASPVFTLLPLIPGMPSLSEAQLREAMNRLHELRIEGQKFIRANPGRSILYAMAGGFVLGLLLRR